MTRGRWAFAAALLLIALNQRVPLTTVGPVLDDVRAELNLSSAAAGGLTTLPLLCFAAAGAAVPAFARRFGPELALLLGLVALISGIALRVVPDAATLFAGTLAAGAGIAVANVLLPALIKREYANPGAMMGLYVGVMTTGAAIGAALTVPLKEALGSWEAALAAWAVPAVLATIAWLPVVRRGRERDAVSSPILRLRGDRLAWMLTGLFAAQSMLFYAIVAWMADLLRAGGMSDAEAGAMLSIALLLGLPSALVTPIAASRMRDQRPLVVSNAALWIAGIVGLLAFGTTLAPLWMVLLGVAQGGGFALALVLLVLRAPDGPHATALSGMAQSVGYALAAVAPSGLGALHDVTGGWTAVLLAMLVLAAVLLFCGLGAGRPGEVRGVVMARARSEPA